MDDDERTVALFQLLHIPIKWDPAPPWVKLTEDQMRKFAAMEIRFSAKVRELATQFAQENAKIAAQKEEEFQKILGVSVK